MNILLFSIYDYNNVYLVATISVLLKRKMFIFA